MWRLIIDDIAEMRPEISRKNLTAKKISITPSHQAVHLGNVPVETRGYSGSSIHAQLGRKTKVTNINHFAEQRRRKRISI